MPIDREDIDPIIESDGDKIHRLVRSSLGFLPLGSGTAVELFNCLVSPPLEKRKIKWMHDVTNSIMDLEANARINIKDLFQQEEFLSILVEATHYALKTHQHEKINALKNSLISSAFPSQLEFFLKKRFLLYIDGFSPEHIIYLNFWHNPELYGIQNNIDWSCLIKENNSSSSDREIIELVEPSLTNNNEVFEMVIEDLYTKGLIGGQGQSMVISKENPIPRPGLTELGEDFVKFINSYEEID